MKSLYLLGTTPGCGKTALAVGMAQKLRDEGFAVGYFKPVGSVPTGYRRVDEDASLMATLLAMGISPEKLTLVSAGPYYLTRYEQPGTLPEEIGEAYRRAAEGRDVMLIEDPGRPHLLLTLGLDAVSLAGHLGAQTVLVSRVENDFSVDRALLFAQYLQGRRVPMLGVVFNNVPRPLLDKTRGVYAPLIEREGVRVLGVLPCRPEIAAPTVQEFADVLGGEILVGEEHLGNLVEEIMIGAMTLESALGYLRRAPRKALITGGDRTDMCMAALETDTAVLILTGGLFPNVNVLARAAERGVPVMLVHYDTYTTVHRLQEVARKIKPDDAEAVSLCRELVDEGIAWEAILSALRS
ncbi:MAG: phosphotransacetylase family protein [Bacillota bacterium]|nr:phosphotransacetylase family protein [Bacillota bacterium]